MQERGTITNMDLKVYVESLRQLPQFTEEMIRLVKEDLRFGLTPKETEEYTRQKLDYSQMRVYSRCLRNGYGKEEMAVLTRKGLSGEQMAVALEFYEKGVPLETIQEIIQTPEQSAFTMKQRLEEVKKQREEAEKQTKEASGIQRLLEKLETITVQMESQEQQGKELFQKLESWQEAGKEQQRQGQEALFSLLAEKDQLLEQQQNELNEARIAIVKLQKEGEKAERETICRSEAGQNRTESKQSLEGQRQESVVEASEAQKKWLQTAESGTEEKKEIIGKPSKVMFGALRVKFRQRKKGNLVQQIAEQGLDREQMAQIRIAMEKGLTEQQIRILIQYRLPAEQMAELIPIALYENRTG